ncbi:hypothetical protein BDR22DRAFT_972958 [Usnea florida]
MARTLLPGGLVYHTITAGFGIFANYVLLGWQVQDSETRIKDSLTESLTESLKKTKNSLTESVEASNNSLTESAETSKNSVTESVQKSQKSVTKSVQKRMKKTEKRVGVLIEKSELRLGARFEDLKENFNCIRHDIFALRVDTQELGRRQQLLDQHEMTRVEGIAVECADKA